MKKLLSFLCATAIVFAGYSLVCAAVIDFEDRALGRYASLTIGDVTFTALDNDLR